MTQKEICFVIMPFGEWFDQYFELLYAPAIAEAGFEPVRTDSLYRPSAIVNDIWELTKRAKILLADLTGKNPNVFYELGLAHALAKPVILLSESLDDVPFDLRALRVINFNKNVPDWGKSLAEKITRAIKEVVASPREAVLPTFLNIDRTAIDKVSGQEREMLEIRRELELIKRMVGRTGLDFSLLVGAPTKTLEMKSPIIVRDLSDALGLRPFKLISELMESGVFASMNQTLDEDFAKRIARRHGVDLQIVPGSAG